MTTGLRALLGAALLTAPLVAQDEPPFATDVLPILRAHCFDCHQAAAMDAGGRLRKPKAGLRLDGRGWILEGGDAGPVLEPGVAEDSELWVRVQLPADDPDVMPSKGEPLTPGQVAILRAWIVAGADFGDWTGAPGPERATEAASPPPAERAWLVELERLAEGLDPPTAAQLERAAAGHARTTSLLGDDQRLLRVSFAGHRDRIDDDALRALAPLSRHVAVLDLARTRISDLGLAEAASLPRLTSLDLSRTATTAAGLRALRGLEHLRRLNLFASTVGDDAVDTLAAIRSLRVVHLWQSRFSAAGIRRLRAARPDLRVVASPDLPAPPGEAAGGDGPRRR